jgi:hypothetical protein
MEVTLELSEKHLLVAEVTLPLLGKHKRWSLREEGAWVPSWLHHLNLRGLGF